MWLRDSLPYDLTFQDTNIPMVRTMIYGYESKVSESTNMQNLEDLATALHTSLLPLANKPTMRPIIFVAHSLGGLIIKQVSSVHVVYLTKANSKTGPDIPVKIYCRG